MIVKPVISAHVENRAETMQNELPARYIRIAIKKR